MNDSILRQPVQSKENEPVDSSLPHDFKTQSYVSHFQMHSALLALSTLGSLHGGQQAENIVLRVTLLLVKPPVNTAFV